MNAVGWLGGGGSAPLLIGVLALRYGLGVAIALASVVYLVAGTLLVIGLWLFVVDDAASLSKPLAVIRAEAPC